MSLTPQQFRRLYHRMLEPRPQGFRIADKTDEAWGVVVTRTAITGVQVWHSLESQTLTLALTTTLTKSLIPTEISPDGSVPETSATGWRMFRWQMPFVDGTIAPQEQPAVAEAIDRVKSDFEWFKLTRTDLKRS